MPLKLAYVSWQCNLTMWPISSFHWILLHLQPCHPVCSNRAQSFIIFYQFTSCAIAQTRWQPSSANMLLVLYGQPHVYSLWVGIHSPLVFLIYFINISYMSILFTAHTLFVFISASCHLRSVISSTHWYSSVGYVNVHMYLTTFFPLSQTLTFSSVYIIWHHTY